MKAWLGSNKDTNPYKNTNTSISKRYINPNANMNRDANTNTKTNKITNTNDCHHQIDREDLRQFKSWLGSNKDKNPYRNTITNTSISKRYTNPNKKI